MVKRVVNNSQVPHLWANQSQDSAKGGGSISFTGRSLFSYAAEIGRLIDAPDGSTIALLVSRTWSITTSAHQSRARGAVHHLTSFTVPRLDINIPGAHADNLAHLVKQYHDTVASMKRARKMPDDWQYQHSTDCANSVSAYAQTFGLTAPSITVALDHADIEAIHNAPDRVAKRAAVAAQQALDQAAREVRDRELRSARIAANALAIDEWRACLRSYLPYDANTDSDGGALVRVSLSGEMLQTSQGAEVPLTDAIRVFRRVAACRAAGIEWHRNGEHIRVGSFQVDHIYPNGSFRAGCHTFNWPEIEAAAKRIGVFEEIA